MSRRMIFPILMGIVGCAVLVVLGVWQVQRMHWKTGVLAEISAMIGADPVPLMAAPEERADKYRPVMMDGRFTGDFVQILAGDGRSIPGVRIIEAFEMTGGRRVMVDRGYLDGDARSIPRPPHAAHVVGNLHWPQDSDSYTPVPDLKAGLWFARDLPTMAAFLHTEPVLIVARDPTGDGIEPVPVDTSNIPNDHWGYAIQWFSLAVVWAGMTLYLLWRIRQRTV